ncbi:MAG: CDP-alcohol phosphatidyltransferase family protein [Desulfatiglandales bacterium]
MDRIFLLIISLCVSLLMYLGFVFILRSERGRDYIGRHWYYHPNAICLWRLCIALPGTILYFVADQHFWGILLFTFAAVLDGVDGLVARKCERVTPLGEELDPLCDKLTYLPAMFFFAYRGLLNVSAVWTLLIIEACGQFLVRYFIKRFTKFSVTANNFGKIKAVMCFALIIYCALLDDALRIPDFSAQMLYLCIILSVSSSVFKLIPNRFYADILSILNLLCGILGIILAFQGRYVYVALAIMAGQIFDLFDGRMAEKHGGTKFGPWLDDIADLVSFGLCPALLIVFKGDMSALPFIFGMLYFLAVGFRLWRYLFRDKYDSTLPPGVFSGLPSPAGAIVVLGACLFLENRWAILGIIFVASFLLVSHVRFVHFGRVILQTLPRTFIVIFGFIILFITAYLIKARDSQMLGALLLICFIVYIVTSTRIMIKKTQ